jgi:hypothetical protein
LPFGPAVIGLHLGDSFVTLQHISGAGQTTLTL